MIEGLKNAIIIDGVVHELVDIEPGKEDDCEICSLIEKCRDYPCAICVDLFDDVEFKMFKERTDL